MKSDMKNLGRRIRHARVSLGMTQEELAEKVDVSRVSIAKYESGEMEPRLSNFKMIADVLNVSADYLLNLNIERTDKKILNHLTPKSLEDMGKLVEELKAQMKKR
jgi:transcriptional regulator with XRE-family HTH domain